jgi:hypothetical protein
LHRKFTANAFFVHQYGQRSTPRPDDVVVDPQLLTQFPQLLSKKVATRSVSDYSYLVGKRYVDDEDKREYEVVKVDVMRDRSIVAYVKWIREPYSKSKLMEAPIHIADVVRLHQQAILKQRSETIEGERKKGEGR